MWASVQTHSCGGAIASPGLGFAIFGHISAKSKREKVHGTALQI
jgi:hypothetical protein